MDHTDREYQVRLGEMRGRILRMAGLVEEMIDSAVTALLTQNTELARRTIEQDARVDALELDIDDLGMTTLARWQPMASDLRFVTLSFKMVTDLERIGDLAVNICERVVSLADSKHSWGWSDVERMSDIAQSMIKGAIDAFLAGNAKEAQAVIEQDDEMDSAYDKAFDAILSSMMADPADIRSGVHGLSIAKWLERIGDHATNLAEQVVFVIDGRDIRHPGRDHSAE